jgi:hypothetical protein
VGTRKTFAQQPINICRENICHRGKMMSLIIRDIGSQTFESNLYKPDQDFDRSIAKKLKTNSYLDEEKAQMENEIISLRGKDNMARGQLL